jgi:hypothetical protein
MAATGLAEVTTPAQRGLQVRSAPITPKYTLLVSGCAVWSTAMPSGSRAI